MERTIDATTTVNAALGRVGAVLLDDPGTLFADRVTIEDRQARRFRTLLSVDVGSGASLQQEVEVHVDPPLPDAQPGTIVLPLQWHATGHEKLFPTFAGQLSAAQSRAGAKLTLRGRYTVPLGAVGRFGNGLAGHQVARKTLAVLLSHIAERVDAEVVRRIDEVPYHPAAHPVS